MSDIRFTNIDALPDKYKENTIFIVCCTEWNEEGYQLCTFNGVEFTYSDQPNDMFMETVESWSMLFWDNF